MLSGLGFAKPLTVLFRMPAEDARSSTSELWSKVSFGRAFMRSRIQRSRCRGVYLFSTGHPSFLPA